MLDWGVERAAWLELISPNNILPNNTNHIGVQAAISEFNLPYPGKTKSLVRYGNHTYRLETNKHLHEGIRFTWLYFDLPEDNTVSVQISNISLVAKIKPTNYSGYFRSSSETLTKTWYTGAYGVRLNMEENNFNTVLVERGDRVPIQGDGHPTVAAALVAFSSYRLVKEELDQTDSGDHQVVDNGIMAYPLYWCLSAMDYFMESGDIDTFSIYAKHIMKILDPRINDFLTPDLDIQWFGWDDRLGNGWCFHANGDRCPKEAHFALAGLVVRVCKDFARVLYLASMPFASQKYQKSAQHLGRRFVSIQQWPSGFGIHSATNAINAGIPNSNEIEYWMKSILNDRVNICSFSQFNQYWILQALGNAGRMEHALASIELCWGTPLKLGRGCFWENSSPEWLSFMKDGDAAPGLQSYCHPWASGVTAWLSHTLGGIRPLLPGYKTFLASPYVSVSYPNVETSILTPQGKIHVNASLYVSGEFYRLRAMIQSPVPGYFGLRHRFTLPNGDQHGTVGMVLLNRKSANVLNAEDIKYLFGVSSNLWPIPEDLVFVKLNEGGIFHISADYDGASLTKTNRELVATSPFPKPHYPASIIGIDVESRGDGLLVHGRDGYYLIGYDSGKDIVQLPDYIQNVTVLQHGYPGWVNPERKFIGASADEKTFLPTVNTSLRKLGMVGFDEPRFAEINNFFLHIESNQRNRTFCLSVYFVATSDEKRHIIRSMDLNNLNVIAPTTLIQNYTNGVWWTLRYNESVRLRLLDIYGLSISAIGFAMC